MHKLTAHWVPRSLSDEQMATRASVYSALLKRFMSKEDDFLSHLVTVDETWVHYYEPENKAQSRQCRAGVSEAKEIQNAIPCWQGDGNCILGCIRHYVNEVNSPKGFCFNRTMQESTLAKLQWMLLSGIGTS